jgi:mono/diheme cytochrome c family protein
MKKVFLLALTISLAIACGKNDSNKEDFSKPVSEPTVSEGEPVAEETTADAGPYDAAKGEGKFDKVELGASLDQKIASEGEKIAGAKCASCHKLTEEKLVGPGWKDVTKRRTPEWIMNFIVNPDPMIDKDPELKKQLEICMVRMPKQSLTDSDARSLLEYMRKNDGVK